MKYNTNESRYKDLHDYLVENKLKIDIDAPEGVVSEKSFDKYWNSDIHDHRRANVSTKKKLYRVKKMFITNFYMWLYRNRSYMDSIK